MTASYTFDVFSSLDAGDGFCIPPDTPHNALDLGPWTGVMLSTYLVDVDRPLSAVAAEP
jgi:hypothetical protein